MEGDAAGRRLRHLGPDGVARPARARPSWSWPCPPTAAPGRLPVAVTETAPQGASRLDLTVTVASQVDSGITLTADFPSLNGGPTDTFSYTLTLTNNTPAAADLQLRGLRAGRVDRDRVPGG